MLAKDFRAALENLGQTQTGIARLFGVEPRTVRRWVSGEREIPIAIARLTRAMLQFPTLRDWMSDQAD